MINVDMKCGPVPRRMARRVKDQTELRILQQLRRDLAKPWDQASIGELGGGLILVLLVIAVLRHWII